MAVRPSRVARYMAQVFGLAALQSGCNQLQVLQVDQIASEPITAWSPEDQSQLPVFVTAPLNRDPCLPSPGPCTNFCDARQSSCDPAACGTLLIDSLAPLSTMLRPELQEPAYYKSCAQLRNAPFEGLNQSEVRLRIHELGTLALPASKTPADRWTLGDGRTLSGVLGGDFLLQFAAEFRFRKGARPQARFFRRLPGAPQRLENRGLSYLAAQSPGQFLGRVPGDQCELVPGLDCDRPIAQLGNLETQQIMPPSRLQLDVCMAPPPCVLFKERGQGCQLRAGVDDPSPCTPWIQTPASGASLILATSVPGIVLFSDSASRIVPEYEGLVDCNRIPETEGVSSLYCKEPGASGELHVPGWEPLTGLTVLKVASLAVLSGQKSQFSDHPCERWEQRVRGLVAQCAAFDRDSTRSYPELEASQEPLLSLGLGHSLLQAGALGKTSDPAQRTQGWLTVTIVPSSAPIVRNLRRSSGTIAAQADGLLGMAALSQTLTYLDFTEREQSPGLRVQCLEPQEGLCRSLPACTDDSSSGDASCCHGLSQTQLKDAIEATPLPDRPHPCCAALSQSSRAELMLRDSTLCPF